MKRNFNDRRKLHRNYYAVSTDNQFVNKIDSSEIPEIKKTRKYKFKTTKDDKNRIECKCKVVVEEVELVKKYFDLYM